MTLKVLKRSLKSKKGLRSFKVKGEKMNYSRFSTTEKEQQTLLFYQGEKGKCRGNSPLKKRVTPLLFLSTDMRSLWIFLHQLEFLNYQKINFLNLKMLLRNPIL